MLFHWPEGAMDTCATRDIRRGHVLRNATACVVLAAFFAVGAIAQEEPSSSAKTDKVTVSLPMYEESEAMKQADDVFWNHLRQKLETEGVDTPATLARTDRSPLDQWKSPHLLLSQTCGYPYVHILMERGIKIIGTPVYTTNHDLPAGEYRSVIIVRAGTAYHSLADLKGKKAGVNDMGSNSGMNAFRAAVAASFPERDLKQGIFASVVTTGGHLNSVRMVDSGQVDVAAIDNVSYDLIRRDHPELAARTRVLMNTPPAPGLPMITSAQTDDATIEKIRAAIKELIAHPSDDALRKALAEMKLEGFVVIDAQTYAQRITQLEDIARDKGYPMLK
jgi:ABC-type phosphate/phosphonate transport system substrate-binding protein